MTKLLKSIRQETTLWHDILKRKSSAYSIWHQNPYHKHFHWLTLFIVILYMVSFVGATFSINVKAIRADELIDEDTIATTTENIATTTENTSTSTQDLIATTTEEIDIATTTEDTFTSTQDLIATSTEDSIATTTEETDISTTTSSIEDITPPLVLVISPPVINSVPTVTKIYSPILKGTFHSGVIPVIVTFSRPIVVSGTPQLILATGIPSTTRVNLKFAVGNKLYFLYHIVSGNSISLLDYTSIFAINLNGGSIRDTSGNNVTVTLPEPGSSDSLSGTSKIVIETSL